MRHCFPPIGAPTIAGSPASSSSIRRRWKRRSPNSTPRCVPATFDHTHPRRLPTEGLTPPKTHWARKIDTPPYLAYPVRPGITFTYLGTRVNKQARMLMKNGKPAANMFAAGEIMAGNVLGRAYAAGIGMTIGSVFGRVAGVEAARMQEIKGKG
jgi:tricarballylate dehydrogenase